MRLTAASSPLHPQAEHRDRHPHRRGDHAFPGCVFLGRRQVHPAENGHVQRRQQRPARVRWGEPLRRGDGGKGAVHVGRECRLGTITINPLLIH